MRKKVEMFRFLTMTMTRLVELGVLQWAKCSKGFSFYKAQCIPSF